MGFLDQKETQQRRALIITAGAVVLFLVILVCLYTNFHTD